MKTYGRSETNKQCEYYITSLNASTLKLGVPTKTDGSFENACPLLARNTGLKRGNGNHSLTKLDITPVTGLINGQK